MAAAGVQGSHHLWDLVNVHSQLNIQVFFSACMANYKTQTQLPPERREQGRLPYMRSTHIPMPKPMYGS